MVARMSLISVSSTPPRQLQSSLAIHSLNHSPLQTDRLFPVDVNFLEQNIEGKIYGKGEAVDAAEEDKYAHRVTLLRSELIELYHATKTREWIEEQVKEKSAEDKSETAPGAAKEITDGAAADTSAEDFVKVDGEQTKEGQAEEAKDSNADEKEEKEQTIIDVGDFKLAFNPDAFVDRAKEPLHTAALAKPDEEEDSTKAVRAASNFLREVVIPSLLREAITDEVIPLDSSHLSQLLHKKGINIRYLGLIAEMTKQTPQLPGGQKLAESAEQEVSALLAKFKVRRAAGVIRLERETREALTECLSLSLLGLPATRHGRQSEQAPPPKVHCWSQDYRAHRSHRPLLELPSWLHRRRDRHHLEQCRLDQDHGGVAPNRTPERGPPQVQIRTPRVIHRRADPSPSTPSRGLPQHRYPACSPSLQL